MQFYRNVKGRQPARSRGKRVFVIMRNGFRPVESWAADTTRWTLEDHISDIIGWALEN